MNNGFAMVAEAEFPTEFGLFSDLWL